MVSPEKNRSFVVNPEFRNNPEKPVNILQNDLDFLVV